MLKVHIVGGIVCEGSVQAIDPVTKTLILKTGDEGSSSYRIIIPSQITQIEGDLASVAIPDLSTLGINLAALEKKETSALKEAERNFASINLKVNQDIQSLFDRLRSLFGEECVWVDESIKILDDFQIDPPYDKVTLDNENVTASKQLGYDRVVKMLEGERKKLQLK